MSATRIFVPSLTGGVSRQPQTQRLATQMEEADNVTMAVERGLQNRSGTIYVSTDLGISQNTINNVHIIWVQRPNASERFFLLIDKTKTDPIRAFLLDGTELSIEYTVSQDTAIKAYLKFGSTSSRTSFASVSIQDTTIIANIDKVTALTGTAANYQYSGTAVRATANAHHKDNAKLFDYPPTASNEYWYATNGSTGFPAGFYITQGHTGVGPWYLQVKTEEANSEIDATTMPVKALLDYANSKVVLSMPSWTPRRSGNSITNPGPSFIGKKITDITYHKGRLFMSAEDRVIGSVTNDLFNFWVVDPTNLGDSDPIDISVSDRAGSVQYMVSFSKALVIFTSGARQFELRSDGPLTPTSANLLGTTSFKSNSTCKPLTLGNHLFFASAKTDSTQIYDYFYSFDAANNIAPDVTKHCSGYVSRLPKKLSTSENNDLVALTTTNDLNKIYWFQSYYQDNQRVQASWYRWVFDSSATIISHEIYDNDMYLLMKYGNVYHIERVNISAPTVDLTDGQSMGYHVRYDRRVTLLGTYDSGTDTTTWVAPYPTTLIEDVTVSAEGGNNKGKRLLVESTIVGGTTELTTRGDWSAWQVYTGVPFEMRVRLSQQFVRDQNSNVVMGTVQLKMLKIDHKDTGYYLVEITPQGRQKNTFKFTPLRIGSYLLGNTSIEDYGTYIVKPMCSAETSIIEFANRTSLPCSISDMEFIVGFIPKKANIAR